MTDLAGNVTAKTEVGLIDAAGLSGSSVSLTADGGGTTDVGAIKISTSA